MTDNKTTLQKFFKELNTSIAKNLRLKAQILMIFFLAIFLLESIGFYLMHEWGWIEKLTLTEYLIVPGLLLIIVLDEVLVIRYLNKVLSYNRTIPRWLTLTMLFLETSFPTIIIFYGCTIVNKIDHISTYDLLNSPPIIVYFIFIILSALHMELKLCLFVGFVAFIEYTYLIYTFLLPEVGPDSFLLVLSFSKGLFFLICGLISGFVCLKIREALISSLKTKDEMINNLDTKVQEATKEIYGHQVAIEQQNYLLQEQNKSIVDSINYAQRIQNAILPPLAFVKELIKDSFILYRPKDIVSGDFYFVDKVGDNVIFSAVDCTGHGVPGAMMSVVGFNGIQQAVKERKLSRPRDILQFLDVQVDKTLRQTEGELGVKDGMDLGLCSLNTKTNMLQFSGAYNPMYIVQTRDGKLDLIEIKGDKLPIGCNDDGEPDDYFNHEIQLEKGDIVYLLSDGYPDQFGGPKGKKFKYKPLKELLLSIYDLSMSDQHEKLIQVFDEWRGDVEQIDDVLLIGVRI